MNCGAVNIPLNDGKVVQIPVGGITYDPNQGQVNISEEMSRTAIWQQLSKNDSQPDTMGGYEMRKR